jgi:hypothetical protein
MFSWTHQHRHALDYRRLQFWKKGTRRCITCLYVQRHLQKHHQQSSILFCSTLLDQFNYIFNGATSYKHRLPRTTSSPPPDFTDVTDIPRNRDVICVYFIPKFRKFSSSSNAQILNSLSVVERHKRRMRFAPQPPENLAISTHDSLTFPKFSLFGQTHAPRKNLQYPLSPPSFEGRAIVLTPPF